ncbi:MAG: hypothetical protein D6744_08600, partial [Planctomycetota bacterium]
MRTIENGHGLNDPNRVTEYDYDPDTGQLVVMRALLPGGAHQETQFLYDAEIVDETFATISANRSLISQVWYPDPVTGAPDPARYLKFKYYSDGSVALREDARGMLLAYTYDELGRIVRIDVNDDAVYGGDPNYAPAQRIAYITHTYSPDGLLEYTTAFDATDNVIAQDLYEYNAARRLAIEWQQIGGVVTSGSPRVDYQWDYRRADQGNFDRLSAIVYPQRTDTSAPRTTLLYHYGDDVGDVDHQLSRLTRIEFHNRGDLAVYEHAGLSRRVATTLGGGVITQTVAGASGYEGLDRYGRLGDLHYRRPGGETLARFRYGYDRAGNRTYARVNQSAGHDNDRSYKYGYDELRRLISADFGRLAPGNAALSATTRAFDWTLDILGNWSGGSAADSFVQRIDRNADGDVVDPNEAILIHHQTDLDNEIDSILVNGAATALAYDLAGNLVLDGQFFYQYDAWNRLIQVNERGALTAADIQPTGLPAAGLHPGPLRMRFVYDGRGRVVAKHMPDPYYATQTYSELYYYDGVRRIHSNSYTPLAWVGRARWSGPEGTPQAGSGSTASAAAAPHDPNRPITPASSGPPAPAPVRDPGGVDPNAAVAEPIAAAAHPSVDPNHATADPTGEANVSTAGGEADPNASDSGASAAGRGTAAGRSAPWLASDYHWTQREWVYGPDYVDELLAAVGEDKQVYFLLADGNYNV